jgi:hypothetical protein
MVTGADPGTVYSTITAIDHQGIYPGSTFYLNVDGQRFEGTEEIVLTPPLIAALRSGQVAHFQWSPWPSGGIREDSVRLPGFSGAYAECIAYFARAAMGMPA